MNLLENSRDQSKVCIRCLSPYEARQMLHRNAFPMKNTLLMEPEKNLNQLIFQRSVEEQESTKFPVYYGSHRGENVTQISRPNSLRRDSIK